MKKPLSQAINDAISSQSPEEALADVISDWQEIVSNPRIISELTNYWLRTASVEKQKIILSVLTDSYPMAKFSIDNSSKIREELNMALREMEPMSSLRSTKSKLLDDGVAEEELTFELTLIHAKQENTSEKIEDALVDVLTNLVR